MGERIFKGAHLCNGISAVDNDMYVLLTCLNKCSSKSRVLFDLTTYNKYLPNFLFFLFFSELKAIVQYLGTPATEGVLSWKDLMEIGEKEDETELVICCPWILIVKWGSKYRRCLLLEWSIVVCSCFFIT